MWDMTQPWWETVIRATVIYFGVFILFRWFGKKQLGEMSPFDFVLLLIVSEAVSGALTGGDNSLATGLICGITLIVLSYFLDVATFKSKKIERFVDGKAQVIITDGKVDRKIQASCLVTDDELAESLRRNGLDNINQVKFAVLETNGKINVIKKDPSA